MKRKAFIAILAALALLAGAATAEAGVVRMTTCINGGGSASTTAGPLQLSLGWGTWSRHFTERFLEVQSVTYVVNGVSTTTAVGDLTGWSPITTGTAGDGSTVYVTRYTSPVVANLAAGESVTVSMTFNSSKKVWDDAKTSYGPGELFPPITCTITATS